MLSDLHIENFRSFKNLDLKNLGRVNLVVGKNNMGKTSLLEAVTMLVTLKRPTDLRQTYRAYPRAEAHFDGWLIHDGSQAREALVMATIDSLPRALRITLDDKSLARAEFSPDALAYSAHTQSAVQPSSDQIDPFAEAVRQRRGEETLEGILRAVDPRVRTVRLTTDPNRNPFIEVDLGLSARMPITQAGEGLSRVLTVLVQLLGAKRQFAFLDEIENGIHHTALPQVWKGIAEIAERMDVQIFATTHSHECLEAAHEAFAARPSYDFRVIQLYRVDQKTDGRVLDRGLIEAAISGEIDLR
jgi:predicted ATPase